MMATSLAALKKRRTVLRNRIKADILALVNMSEGELSQFEATHALLDTIIQEQDQMVRTYGKPATLNMGLAQTYLPSTTELAEAHAQANGGPIKKVYNGLKDLVDAKGPIFKAAFKGQSAETYMWDDPAETAPAKLTYADVQKAGKGFLTPSGPETVEGKITKNLEAWAKPQPHTYMKGSNTFVVGGLVANATIEQYGYELPPGYDFIPYNAGESKVTKLSPKLEQYTFALPKLGSVTLSPGEHWNLSGYAAATIKYKLADFENLLAGTPIQVAKSHSQDLFTFIYPPTTKPAPAPYDLDAHLDDYKKKLDPNKMYAPKLYSLKNSIGEVSEVPFQKWLTEKNLQDLYLWSLALPNGIMWHSHDGYDGKPMQWYLDYAGSKPPVWDNF